MEACGRGKGSVSERQRVAAVPRGPRGQDGSSRSTVWERRCVDGTVAEGKGGSRRTRGCVGRDSRLRGGR